MEKLSWYQYFEVGNILRALRSNNNVLGEHVRDCMNQGKMIDDTIVFGLFDIYQQLLQSEEYMLIDGFLRKMPQLYYYFNQEYINKRDFIGIHFRLSKEKAIERLVKRAQLEWRTDDTEDAINVRLSIYEQETVPVINHLDSLGKIIHIDADQSIEKIYQDTLDALKKAEIL